MTINELIEQLEQARDQFGGNTEVKVGYPYGDYPNTTVLKDVDELQLQQCTWSKYHEAYRQTTPEDDNNPLALVDDYLVIL